MPENKSEDCNSVHGDKIRISVATSVKGVKTYDCSVTTERLIGQAALDYSFDLHRQLVARLDTEYPSNIQS